MIMIIGGASQPRDRVSAPTGGCSSSSEHPCFRVSAKAKESYRATVLLSRIFEHLASFGVFIFP